MVFAKNAQMDIIIIKMKEFVSKQILFVKIMIKVMDSVQTVIKDLPYKLENV